MRSGHVLAYSSRRASLRAARRRDRARWDRKPARPQAPPVRWLPGLRKPTSASSPGHELAIPNSATGIPPGAEYGISSKSRMKADSPNFLSGFDKRFACSARISMNRRVGLR
jgi:hypothetical protein